MANELERPLAAAIEIARAGGALIRAEFHSTHGIRGNGVDHADVDDEVEALVRARLLAEFPDWGYRGEETGSTGINPPPRFIWLVDPNDGTRNFLQGTRGSSVSIALLRDRVPVLGVVFSPLAPDDAGDMIAWAEGCGPITRNGEPVELDPWPAQLGPLDIVLVSQDIEGVAANALRLSAPARYRAMPSIAYRLALAAAGDGVVGTSFKGAGDWDYAGGQALLRASGANLFSEHGEPEVYSERGESRSRMCLGGPEAVVRQLLERPWASVYEREPHPRSYPKLIPHAYLRRGQAIDDPALLSRAQGALLGQLAGDSLGSLVEFESSDAIARNYPNGVRQLANGGPHRTMAGQPTDDSELALMLGRSILGAGGYDRESAARAYGYWYRSEPFDMGGTTRRALTAIPANVWVSPRLGLGEIAEQAAMGAADPESQANGSLMRISPLAIWGWQTDPDVLADLARADSELTHPNLVCQEACAVYVVALAHGIASGASSQEVYAFARDWARTSGRAPEVRAAVEAAEREAPADYISQQGWALIALQNAFFQLLHAPSTEEGIVATVMAGGDTDTNAAIAGALLGGVYGRDAIPRKWRNLILSCRPMEGIPGVTRPRPAPFWPVDALELAEQLLLLG
jgi:ADP-ribosyl-[dinitrogen reductase] hydrolase